MAEKREPSKPATEPVGKTLAELIKEHGRDVPLLELTKRKDWRETPLAELTKKHGKDIPPTELRAAQWYADRNDPDVWLRVPALDANPQSVNFAGFELPIIGPNLEADGRWADMRRILRGARRMRRKAQDLHAIDDEALLKIRQDAYEADRKPDDRFMAGFRYTAITRALSRCMDYKQTAEDQREYAEEMAFISVILEEWETDAVREQASAAGRAKREPTAHGKMKGRILAVMRKAKRRDLDFWGFIEQWQGNTEDGLSLHFDGKRYIITDENHAGDGTPPFISYQFSTLERLYSESTKQK